MRIKLLIIFIISLSSLSYTRTIAIAFKKINVSKNGEYKTIQQAINAPYSCLKIFLENKTYIIEKSIIIKNRHRLHIHGRKKTRILILEKNKPVFKIKDSYSVQFFNLNIKRSNSNGYRQAPLIHAEKNYVVSFDSCKLNGYSEIGLSANNNDYVVFTRCKIYNSKIGVLAQKVGVFVMQHCRIYKNRQAGLKLMKVKKGNISYCIFKDNGKNDIEKHNIGKIVIKNNEYSENGKKYYPTSPDN